MEAQATVGQGIELEAETLEVDSLARFNVSVVRVGGIGQLGLVEVVARFGEDNPFLPKVDTDAEYGSDVLSEKVLLFERGAVGDVQIHLNALELQFVAQSDVVDVFAGLVFNHVDRIGRLEHVEVAVPHQSVGVTALHGLVDEG